MTIRPYEVYHEREISALYASAGWTNYTDRPEMLRDAFAHSLLILGAYENEKLVGLVRAVGDGFSVVLVQDLLVLPGHRRRGIGAALLREVTERFRDTYQLQLVTDNTPEHAAFYRKLGMTDMSELGCAVYQRL